MLRQRGFVPARNEVVARRSDATRTSKRCHQAQSARSIDGKCDRAGVVRPWMGAGMSGGAVDGPSLSPAESPPRSAVVGVVTEKGHPP